jgi:hypothetical protein
MKEWTGHLARRLSAQRSVEPSEETIGDEELKGPLLVDLACSGWWRAVADEVGAYWSAGYLALARQDSAGARAEGQPKDDGAKARQVAEQLTQQLALVGPLDVDWCATRLSVLWSRQHALEELTMQFRSHPAVAGRIIDHRADWTKFVFDSLSLPTRAAADEALMCARADHLAAGEVARLAGRRLEQVAGRRDGSPPDVAAILAGARLGEALGPLQRREGDFVVLWLRERRAPSAEQPATRAEAAKELLSEALARVAAGRVRAVGLL